MKKFKNKLLILTAIASLIGLCGNIQTHAMTNNSIEEKNDFLCKKRNKANTKDSKNDNYFYNKFPFNYDNLNNSFDEEKSYEFKPDEFKPDKLKPDEFTEGFFYEIDDKFTSFDDIRKKIFEKHFSKNKYGEYNLNYKQMGLYVYFDKNGSNKGKSNLKDLKKKQMYEFIKENYIDVPVQVSEDIKEEFLNEYIGENYENLLKNRDNNYKFTIKQNDNGSYVGVTQEDKNKIEQLLKLLEKESKKSEISLDHSNKFYFKCFIRCLLMANTKIQKSDNKTYYLDENTAVKFADFLLDKIKNVNNKSNNSANNEQNENVSNNENIISPYNSLKKDFYGIIEKYKDYFQVYKEGEQKGEPSYSYSTIYTYINEMRKAALLINRKKYSINISTANQIFDEILMEAIRKEHKDNENYIFNFTIQNDNGNYVGVTQNDKNKIQTIISTLTNAIKALSQNSISGYRNGVKYLLMADTKIQKSDNTTDYLDEDTTDEFVKQLIKEAKANIK